MQTSILLMLHEGECYRNSNLHPAPEEEIHAIIAACNSLLTKDSKYIGDYKAAFATIVNSDNDTRAPKSFICEQME